MKLRHAFRNRSGWGILILVSFAFLWACENGGNAEDPLDPPNSRWTWMSGSDVAYQPGVYGTKGTADPSNVPGARVGAVSWTDSQGNFWLFGGYGQDETSEVFFLNDLWKFDPAALEWTWISGSSVGNQVGVYGTKGAADPSNVPGGRDGAVAWCDADGELWLFGGYGYIGNGYSTRNDLWRFDPATLEWTWVSGASIPSQPGAYGTKGTSDPSNVPGARGAGVSWMDHEGKLWLFGGGGYDSSGNNGRLDDIWKFDPSTLEWTWVSGSDAVPQVAVYGIKGVADPSNTPGGRSSAASWLDSSGNLWLFGGMGTASLGYLQNDLWEYNTTTSQWTWISGSESHFERGIYRNKGKADPIAFPGVRHAAISWLDATGGLWLFGGFGYAENSFGHLNDLWRLDPATLEWTWVSGDEIAEQPAVFGAKRKLDPSSVPGGKAIAVGWMDAQGNLWLFGGEEGGGLTRNDLWKYTR
jgi:N-acetylneuraminic acid mutarotase